MIVTYRARADESTVYDVLIGDVHIGCAHGKTADEQTAGLRWWSFGALEDLSELLATDRLLHAIACRAEVEWRGRGKEDAALRNLRDSLLTYASEYREKQTT